jgi:hypothetical protein
VRLVVGYGTVEPDNSQRKESETLRAIAHQRTTNTSATTSPDPLVPNLRFQQGDTRAEDAESRCRDGYSAQYEQQTLWHSNAVETMGAR